MEGERDKKVGKPMEAINNQGHSSKEKNMKDVKNSKIQIRNLKDMEQATLFEEAPNNAKSNHTEENPKAHMQQDIGPPVGNSTSINKSPKRFSKFW